MKNIYEIFDEFELAKNKKARMDVIGNNLSRVLTEVLQLTFHPQYEWHVKEVPEGYAIKDIPAGMGYAQLSTEIRKMYMFQKGHPTADKLTDKKREQLLVEYLQNLEPREAEVVMGIFNKDLGVKGLDYKFVKEAFPNLLP
jgi:hypothetical protein